MRTISDRDCETAIGDLLNGPGYHLFESVFDGAEVAEANRIINHHSDTAQAATHFHGEHADKIHLQRRVWNLLNKGQVFVDMVQQNAVMKVFGKILGKQFILGSFAANRLLPVLGGCCPVWTSMGGDIWLYSVGRQARHGCWL